MFFGMDVGCNVFISDEEFDFFLFGESEGYKILEFFLGYEFVCVLVYKFMQIFVFQLGFMMQDLDQVCLGGKLMFVEILGVGDL